MSHVDNKRMDLEPSDIISATGIVVALFGGVLAALAGAVIGGCIAGYYSLKATEKLLAAERATRMEERTEKINIILSSLYHELKIVWAHYIDGVGDLLEKSPPDKPFVYTVANTGSRYPIYEANVQNIGLIPDPALRDTIITAYTSLKSLHDDYIFNNQFLEETALAGERNRLENTAASASLVVIKEPILISCANNLRAEHARAKIAVESLIRDLAEYSSK